MVNDFDTDPIDKPPKELDDGDDKCFDFVYGFCDNDGNFLL